MSILTGDFPPTLLCLHSNIVLIPTVYLTNDERPKDFMKIEMGRMALKYSMRVSVSFAFDFPAKIL